MPTATTARTHSHAVNQAGTHTDLTQDDIETNFIPMPVLVVDSGCLKSLTFLSKHLCVWHCDMIQWRKINFSSREQTLIWNYSQ